jgi:hypothetical protein
LSLVETLKSIFTTSVQQYRDQLRSASLPQSPRARHYNNFAVAVMKGLTKVFSNTVITREVSCHAQGNPSPTAAPR